MSSLRAECTDVKARGAERRGKRRIIQFGIMCQGHERAARTERRTRQRFIRPFVREPALWKSLRGRERRSRVDDENIVARQTRHGDESLCDVHGSDHDELER